LDGRRGWGGGESDKEGAEYKHTHGMSCEKQKGLMVRL
jgi:hypothetical protein